MIFSSRKTCEILFSCISCSSSSLFASVDVVVVLIFVVSVVEIFELFGKITVVFPHKTLCGVLIQYNDDDERYVEVVYVVVAILFEVSDE